MRERRTGIPVDYGCAPRKEGSTVSRPPGEVGVERDVTLRLDSFAWEAIEEECARTGVSAQELVRFSVLYYLADLDSGRIARRIVNRPAPPVEE